MKNVSPLRTTQKNEEQNNNNDLFQNFHCSQSDTLKIASTTSFSKTENNNRSPQSHQRDYLICRDQIFQLCITNCTTNFKI